MTQYAVTIPLEVYADGLLPYKIKTVKLNGIDVKVEQLSFLGFLNNFPEGLFYEIVDDTSVKLFPVGLDDKIQLPVIFKTDIAETEIPIALEEYKMEIASGVIAELRVMPPFRNDDQRYHEQKYKKGIQMAQNEWYKANSPSRKGGTGRV